jgi:hypothetical protein
MGKRNNPGCNDCCGPGGGLDPECYFVADNFNRPDDTDLGSEWEEISGSWETLGNVLHGSGTVLATTSSPSGPSMHVTVKVKGTGSVTILLAADEDATNYISATLTFGAEGTLSVSQTGGEGDSESVPLATEEDTWYTLVACYDGTTARATVDATTVAATLSDITGDRAGLKASTANDFDDFFAAEISEDCAQCSGGGVIGTTGCVFCAGGVVAEYYQVEISGMAEFADCPDCESLDGVYIMGPMQQINIDGDPINCSDGMLLGTICAESDAPGCYGLIGLQFFQDGGTFHLLVNLQTGATDCGHGGGQPSIEWEASFGPSPPDCLFLDEFGVPQPQSLTWITNGIPTTERCDGSGATCIVTAISGP